MKNIKKDQIIVTKKSHQKIPNNYSQHEPIEGGFDIKEDKRAKNIKKHLKKCLKISFKERYHYTKQRTNVCKICKKTFSVRETLIRTIGMPAYIETLQ